MNSIPPPGQSDRRSFFKEAAAVIIGALATLVPLISGIVVLFDPLRKESGGGDFVFVAPLSALPEDDLPRKFSVIAGHTDAWSRIPPAPIGAVYLRRDKQSVQALSGVCPDLGCFVDFNADTKRYLCPCYKSTLRNDG